jgi:hypothetical protein
VDRVQHHFPYALEIEWSGGEVKEGAKADSEATEFVARRRTNVLQHVASLMRRECEQMPERGVEGGREQEGESRRERAGGREQEGESRRERAGGREQERECEN